MTLSIRGLSASDMAEGAMDLRDPMGKLIFDSSFHARKWVKGGGRRS